MVSNTCGNPLLQEWIKEWMDQAGALNSKSYYTYKKAYDSLTKCPITYNHPAETTVLSGIGPGLASRLEKKLEEYCKENGLPMPESPIKKKKKNSSSTNGDDIEDKTTPVRKKPQKTYIPTYRSGGYGIMLSLLDIHEVGRENFTREQICRLAQTYCDASFTLADSGKSYTAWNSIKTLERNSYVYKNGKPAKYCLTETGLEIAKKLKETAEGNKSITESTSTCRSPSSSTSTAIEEPISRNPSAARGSRKRAGGSSTSAILDTLLDSYDDSQNGLDLSMYVSNPSEHQSITVNGQTLNRVGSSSNGQSSTDILQALSNGNRPNKRKGPEKKRGGGNKRQRQAIPKSSTAACLDRLLASYDQESSGLDMSQYVMNPSAYQSISLGNNTVHNKPTSSTSSSRIPIPQSTSNSNFNTSSASRSNASSVTSSSTSSFARHVIDADDDDIYDFSSDRFVMSSSSQRYSTPASSKILQADSKKKQPSKTNKTKPSYNLDEYSIDFSPPILPTFTPSSSQKIQSNEIVDLLSSPETSPVIQPTLSQVDRDLTFDDDFNLDEDYFPVTQSRTKNIKDDIFHYTYLDVDEKDVRSVAQAAIIIDDEKSCLAYRIRFYTSQSDHPRYKSLIQVAVDDTHIGCSIGYIGELEKDPVCPGLPARPVLPLHREDPDDFWPQDKNATSSQTSIRNDQNDYLFSSQNSQRSPSQRSSSQHFTSQPTFSQPTFSQPTFSQPTFSQPTFSQPISSQPISSQAISSQGQSQKQPVDYTQLIESEPLECMLPHEYEIVLVLDSREIQMLKNRDYFQSQLTERGVNFVTRSLDLGDVIWVAKKIGSNNQSDEVFLDYIIERKRLDDLVSSIKDGRFTEQKTRLKKSGSEKVIYIVEEYNRDEVINFGLQAVRTAMSSTQIIDGFFLKKTNGVDESIDYIVSVTKLIHRIYKDTTLYTIPSHIITRQNYLSLKDAYKAKSKSNTREKSAYLVNYPLFGELNSKNSSTSVHEVYLKMLMTIRGVNAERALSLMQIYPTPNSLLRAFRGKSVDDAKSMLKDATQHHISRRRWGTQISERLYNIWGAMEYPDPKEDDE